MNKQFISKIIFATFSSFGVISTISPVSAFVPVGNSIKPENQTTQIGSSLPTLTTETAAVTKLETTIGEPNKLIDAELKETTITNIGQLAGASTDSLTTASVTDPTTINLDSLKQQLNQPTEIIQKTGEATVKINSDEQGIHVDAKADLGVEVANLATVGICLDGSASLGSSDDGSFANCSKSVQPKKVPEPASIGGIILLGTYLISHRKRKVSQSIEHQNI